MSEVRRWKLKGFIPGIEGESKAVFQPTVVLEEDYDAALDREASLREEKKQLRHDIASYLETTAKVCELLGVDVNAAKNAEGKPSDVFHAHAQALQQRLTEADKHAGKAEELLQASLDALCECRALLHAHTTSPQCSRSKMHGEIGLARIDRLTDKLRSALPRQL